jgi:hypothetical protein
LHFLPVQVGGPDAEQVLVTAVPVDVTSAFAQARPTNVPPNVPPVLVMAAPARIVPTNREFVIVAAWATHHVTLHGCAPPAMTTEKWVPVRAPVPRVPILKIQVPFEGPLSVNTPVNVAAAGKQYEPGESVLPSRVPVKVVQTSPALGASAAYAPRKAL